MRKNLHNLAFLIFCFVTLGVASPYMVMATDYLNSANCHCCVRQTKTCPTCAIKGHGHAMKKSGCNRLDKSKKSNTDSKSNYKKAGCSPVNDFFMVKLIQDPFLVGKTFAINLSWDIKTQASFFYHIKEQNSFKQLLRPPCLV